MHGHCEHTSKFSLDLSLLATTDWISLSQHNIKSKSFVRVMVISILIAIPKCRLSMSTSKVMMNIKAKMLFPFQFCTMAVMNK